MLYVEISLGYDEAIDRMIYLIQCFFFTMYFDENAVAYKLSVLTDANIFEINVHTRIAY